MATVGVALVDGVRRSGYLFAPGFVGDGSQLTNVNIETINNSVTINGNLYVSGTTFNSNNVTFENSVISVGSGDDYEVYQKGILFPGSNENVMISYSKSNDALTFGYTKNSATDMRLLPVLDRDLSIDVIGNVSAKNFLGSASKLESVIDASEGVYGGEFSVPQISVSSSGRMSLVEVPILSNLETVTTLGPVTSKSIQLTNENVSLVTSGKVGISNTNPTSLLCVGDGVQITEGGQVTAKNFEGNGSAIINTTDALYGKYGDTLHGVQIIVDRNGRISDIEQIPIKSNLDTVTRCGSLSKSTIVLEHAPTSLTTTGKVGISNTTPNSLLCIGTSTRFDEIDLLMPSGTVRAQNFVGNAYQLTNTSDVKPGVYGGSSLIPQIWVNDQGRISDVQVAQIFMTLDQVTQFNSSTRSTIQLKNSGTGLVSEGDIKLAYGKDVIFLNDVLNPVCTFGQNSQIDSKTVNLSGANSETILNISEWESVRIHSSLQLSKLATMKGCVMESGTGYILNAQQLLKTNETLVLDSSDLFKWFSFEAPIDKDIYLPVPSACQAGSWIGVTNVSKTSSINIFDASGNVVSVIKKEKSKRFLCVSTLATSNGFNVFGCRWIIS